MAEISERERAEIDRLMHLAAIIREQGREAAARIVDEEAAALYAEAAALSGRGHTADTNL